MDDIVRTYRDTGKVYITTIEPDCNLCLYRKAYCDGCINREEFNGHCAVCG